MAKKKPLPSTEEKAPEGPMQALFALIWKAPPAVRALLAILVVAAAGGFAFWLSLPDKSKEKFADKVASQSSESGTSNELLSPELVSLVNSYLNEPIRTLEAKDGQTFITIEPHSLRESNDYTYVANMSPEKCAEACLLDPKCEAYDFDNTPSSPEYKRCWKKRPAPAVTRRVGVVSGTKKVASPLKTPAA